MTGEKKGGGIRIIVKEKLGRKIEFLLTGDDEKLGQGKGDTVTVKVVKNTDTWWITVLYMGVEGVDNSEESRKKYTDVKQKVGSEK